MSFMGSGTYMIEITGWATTATTPAPVVAPFVAIGATRIDDSGNMTGIGPLTNVVAGTTYVDSLTTSKIAVASDCSVTFKASCANGCVWEGNGFLVRNGAIKEIHLMFTKSNGYPLTAIAVLKQILN